MPTDSNSHYARTPARARHGPSGGVGSCSKRSRTAFASPSRCWEYWSVYELTHRAPASRRAAGSNAPSIEMCPNLLADYLYLWETTAVRQAIETARTSVSSGGHSSSYWCQQRQLAASCRSGAGTRARALDGGNRAPSAAGSQRASRQGGRSRAGLPLDRGLPPLRNRPPRPVVGSPVEMIASPPKLVVTRAIARAARPSLPTSARQDIGGSHVERKVVFLCNVDFEDLGVAPAEALQFMTYGAGGVFVVENLPPRVISRPPAVAAGIPAGNPPDRSGLKCDAIGHRAPLSPRAYKTVISRSHSLNDGPPQIVGIEPIRAKKRHTRGAFGRRAARTRAREAGYRPALTLRAGHGCPSREGGADDRLPRPLPPPDRPTLRSATRPRGPRSRSRWER